MGRPLNPRYFISQGQGPVLRPVTQINQVVMPSVILNQLNKQSYLCRQLTTGHQGVCKLALGLIHDGCMILRFQDRSGHLYHASKITNLFVWDFSGQKYTWSFQPNHPHCQVYIIDQSSQQ